MPEHYRPYRRLVRVFLVLKEQWDRRRDRLRYEYWKQQLGFLGYGAKIYGRIVVERPQRVFVGHYTTLNEGVTIFARAPVTIGKGAFVGTGAVVTQNVPEDALALARSRQLVKEGWAKEFRDRRTQEKQDKKG